MAGSTVRLCDAVDNITRYAGAAFGDAVGMATSNPARLLGADDDRGFLRIGGRADLVLFHCSGARYELALTIIGGEVAYEV